MIQPANGFGCHNVPTHDVPLGFPKNVESICPECRKIISAVIDEENGKVIMKKSCKEHGEFRDTVFSHAGLYKKIERWTFDDGPGIENANIKGHGKCNAVCGLCDLHKSHSCLTNIDLTNRCNLRCPICFANANVQGYVYELTLGQIRGALENTKRSNHPQETHVVQFSGGEPTIHPHFLEALRIAKHDLDFSHVQIATNGILIAKDLDFTYKCKEAGLDCIYLQFDGTEESIYVKTRGLPLFDKIKIKAIENCRKANIGVSLVPTIVKTVNDHQIGAILQFAIDNCDVVRGISYQPVAFTGRYDEKTREKYRFTLSDLAFACQEQTGYTDAMNDWYPLSSTSPFTKVLSKLRGHQTINITCHSNCGIGTYFFINGKDRSIKPMAIPQFVDVENLLTEMNNLAKQKKGRFSFDELKTLNILKKNFNSDKAPKGLNFQIFMKTLSEIGIDKSSNNPWRTLFCAGMHFQDYYNFNTHRTQRCAIHYSAPDGKLYPFCTYNSGPEYRVKIEKQFSIPLNEWIRKKGGQYISTGIYTDTEGVKEKETVIV